MSAQDKKGLVAFPSVSSSLHSLPRATSMSNVSLHPNMYAARAKESQAKLQHAFTKPIMSPNSPTPCPSSTAAAPLMMRTPISPRIWAARLGPAICSDCLLLSRCRSRSFSFVARRMTSSPRTTLYYTIDIIIFLAYFWASGYSLHYSITHTMIPFPYVWKDGGNPTCYPMSAGVTNLKGGREYCIESSTY
ncbi:hypothetical protein FB45DRAFT_1006437 [Roridomyces roridus]|uniref:Uncharacterized protein n=1 Tax=Roridomyces roridus TaxID=1738132 RepID=A0AAD7FIJ9_9AGAR|nr:hypothetical protein FB45DRAFT_1006437 [Roridomyces roridus]